MTKERHGTKEAKKEAVLTKKEKKTAKQVKKHAKRAGPVCLDSISTEISGALRGSVIHGDGGRRSL
jgi:hypothetical protein